MTEYFSYDRAILLHETVVSDFWLPYQEAATDPLTHQC